MLLFETIITLLEFENQFEQLKIQIKQSAFKIEAMNFTFFNKSGQKLYQTPETDANNASMDCIKSSKKSKRSR